jgi:hypothetical protein
MFRRGEFSVISNSYIKRRGLRSGKLDSSGAVHPIFRTADASSAVGREELCSEGADGDTNILA